MSNLKITYTDRFLKSFKNLTGVEKKQLKNKLSLPAQNPTHPSLRTKRIQGTDDLFECSVNMDIRIIWFYEGDSVIILLDVGHHDILKNFDQLLKACPCLAARLYFILYIVYYATHTTLYIVF